MLKILNALNGENGAMASLMNGHDVSAPMPDRPLVENVRDGEYHLVLVDGEPAVARALREADPRISIILFGREGEELRAVTEGATAHFTRPPDAGRLAAVIKQVDEEFALRKETGKLEKELHDKYTLSRPVVGRNPKMLEMFSFIRRVAPYYKTVLITGETGTGKECIAQALHELGSPGKPFVALNCGGLTETLLESELFGYKRGAFTGAFSDKKGLFEAAGEGNIFLDEIGDMPLSFQPGFLRVLESGEFRPVGSNLSLRAACRVIAATNKDLKEEVRAGRFRDDLYYRLTPVVVHVPALRERKDDIPLLSRELLDRFNRRTGRNIRGISRPAQAAIMAYDWPGNVRELENVIEQAAMVTSESFIRLEDLPPLLREGRPPKPSAEVDSLDSVIKEHIALALRLSGSNRTHAARKLHISRRALLRKMQKYSLS
jgi:DNA-binding NtrC family response regulator